MLCALDFGTNTEWHKTWCQVKGTLFLYLWPLSCSCLWMSAQRTYVFLHQPTTKVLILLSLITMCLIMDFTNTRSENIFCLCDSRVLLHRVSTDNCLSLDEGSLDMWLWLMSLIYCSVVQYELKPNFLPEGEGYHVTLKFKISQPIRKQ